MERYLVCRIGWMNRYQGLAADDSITGAGSFIDEHEYGDEVYNFAEYKGGVYGGLRPNPHYTIDITRLGANENDHRVKGVTVIWVAPHPDGKGTYVIGWYKDATIHSDYQAAPAGSRRPLPNEPEPCGFMVEANKTNALCLPETQRTLLVPQGKGALGRSNVWFCESDKGAKFVQAFKKLIASTAPTSNQHQTSIAPATTSRQFDTAKRLKVEAMAMEAVAEFFEHQGYTITFVHKDNLGWDLEIRPAGKRGSQPILVEVKGLSGDAVVVELTPNEFKQMNDRAPEFRLCVVTGADHLSRQKLHCFTYSRDEGSWIDQEGRELFIEPVIAARCSAK